MQVQLGSQNKRVPFQLIANSGDFRLAPGASPTVQLEKNGAPPVPAAGTISTNGTGTYWLNGHPNDRDTLGMVVLLVTAPSGDIAPSTAYEVVAFDPDSPPSPTGLTIAGGFGAIDSQNLAALLADMRLLVKYSIPSTAQGGIQ